MGKPRERGETGEQDLFRARLDQILNMNHALVRLARTIDWPVLEARFGSVYSDGPGMPPLPTRLVIGHIKSEHRMGRNYLAHSQGDAINAILAAAGYNFSLLLRWLKTPLWLMILLPLIRPKQLAA